MLRRQWIQLAATAIGVACQRGQAQNAADTTIAGATQATPRVGIVLSSFSGAKDHDGTAVPGLSSPVAPDSPASDALLDEMVRKAIELGNTSRGDLSRIVRRQDWVVIQPQMAICQRTDGSFVPGATADLRVVGSVAGWLAERGRASRITIAGAPSWSMEPSFDPWETDWSGAFGKISYRQLVEELGGRYPSIQFDIADLTDGETMALQPPGGSTPSGQAPAVYQFPMPLLTCDKLITVAPLSTSSSTVVSLSLGGYSSVVPSAQRTKLREVPRNSGDRFALLADVVSLRPPDYSILGGAQGLEGNAPYGLDAHPVNHNLVLAGANAVSVDAVGAAVMGFDPTKIKHLELAAQRGFGNADTDSIWTRGNEIKEAKRPFRPATERPTGG
jgi:uncharacterized protein (DUF362 family)